MTEMEKTHAIRMAINMEGSEPAKKKSWEAGVIEVLGQDTGYVFEGFNEKQIPRVRSHDTVNGEHFEEFGPEQVRDEYLQKLEYFKTTAKELGFDICDQQDRTIITIHKPRV